MNVNSILFKSFLLKFNRINFNQRLTKTGIINLKNNVQRCEVREEYKLAIDSNFKNFISNPNQTVYKFSPLLNIKEREYVHMMAIRHGLKSKSQGNASGRYISVFKEGSKQSTLWDFSIKRETAQAIYDLFKNHPVTEAEIKLLESISKKSETSDFQFLNYNENFRDFDFELIPPLVPPQSKTSSQSYLEKKKLPVWQYENQIIDLINSNQVILISGDTGCGKTTQVPQFILDHCTKTNTPCHVIVAEPRRIAATSVAERVARERNEFVGQTVGYHIRLDNKTSSDTCLTFCTNGILLRKLMQGKKFLTGITHIIVDEVHERDHKCDFLLLSLLDLLPQNPNIKVIIMSATLDNEKFSQYFNNCPTVTVPGVRYNVEQYFLEDILKMTNWQENVKKLNQQMPLKKKSMNQNNSQLLPLYNTKSLISDLICNQDSLSIQSQNLLELYYQYFDDELIDFNLIIDLISFIIKDKDKEKNKKGAILIFLPGYDEIVTLRDLITSSSKISQNCYELFTLHSQIQNLDQKKVFDPILNKRKIILSTNIAETSVTINDVVYVIDSGKVKEKTYDNFLGSSILQSKWISQSSAIQRRGRAGRCQNGVCFHLFSKSRFENMEKHRVPEILRMSIYELCLQAKLLAPKYPLLKSFLQKSLDPPSESAVESSIEYLKTIEAFDQNEQLTKLGYHLLNLSIDPRLGKMILSSVVLKCLNPVLILASTLGCQNPFIIPMDLIAKKDAKLIRHNLSSGSYSDHFMFLKAFQSWKQACRHGHPQLFSHNNFIRNSAMVTIEGIFFQLLNQLKAADLIKLSGPGDIHDLNQNSDKWPVIKAALCTGCYPQVIKICPESQKLITHKEKNARIHPSSVISANAFSKKRQKIYFSSLPLNWIIFEEMIGIGSSSFAKICSLVSTINVLLFAGQARSKKEVLNQDKDELHLDDLIKFKTSPLVGPLVRDLRIKYQALFLRRLEDYKTPPSVIDEKILKTVVKVLSIEEPKESSELLKNEFDSLISSNFLKKLIFNQKRKILEN